MTYYSYAPVDSNSYLWVSANDRTITAIDLLSPAQLAKQQESSAQYDDKRLKPFIDLLLAYLRGERKDISSLPLVIEELKGSNFFRQVWRVLLSIPPGATMTYKEVAAYLGNKNKARAVGMACAANPVVLAVPCHRVVAANGLGGYRWGLEWKQKLLSMESIWNPPVSFSDESIQSADW